jgi:transcriptional regulator with XRE-family HTH domain
MGAFARVVAFLAKVRQAYGVDKFEYAARLREAIARQGYTKTALADAVEVKLRTVTNWTSREKPTTPGPVDQEKLRRLLGDFDRPGDEVIAALDRSPLTEWRRDAVRSVYRKHLHEQDEEAERRRGA